LKTVNSIKTNNFEDLAGKLRGQIHNLKPNLLDTNNMRNHPFLIPAIIFFLLSIPLICGIVPPNRGYGIRTAKTMSEPGIWYSANKFGGWALLVSSGIYLAMTVVSPSADRDFTIWLFHLSAFSIPLLVSLLLIRRYINKL